MALDAKVFTEFELTVNDRIAARYAQVFPPLSSLAQDPPLDAPWSAPGRGCPKRRRAQDPHCLPDRHGKDNRQMKTDEAIFLPLTKWISTGFILMTCDNRIVARRASFETVIMPLLDEVSPASSLPHQAHALYCCSDHTGSGIMKRLLMFCVLATMSVSCAADKMRSYIGQDIRAVELNYGPPSNQIDLGNGTRAFQWTKISVDTTPMSAVTTTDKDRKGRKSTQTQFVGGNQTVTRCLYTFITTWNPQGDGWVVTGIREPSFDCAVGDLS